MGKADRVAARGQLLEELERRFIVAALIGGGRVIGLFRNSRKCPHNANNGERDYRRPHRPLYSGEPASDGCRSTRSRYCLQRSAINKNRHQLRDN
jgi:hypothetical protein